MIVITAKSGARFEYYGDIQIVLGDTGELVHIEGKCKEPFTEEITVMTWDRWPVQDIESIKGE